MSSDPCSEQGRALPFFSAAWWASAWLGGVALQLQQGALWPLRTVGVLGGVAFVASLALAWCGRTKGPAWASIAGHAVLLLVSGGLLGFCSTAWRAQQRLDDALPAALEGVDLVVVGTITQLPHTGLLGTRFVFEVESARRLRPDPSGPMDAPAATNHAGATAMNSSHDAQKSAAVRLPRQLALAWYRVAEPDALLLGPSIDLRAGQRWQLTVRLQRPHGAVNPHGFDLELWLFEQGLGAVGRVRSQAGDVARLLAERHGAPIERWRHGVRDAIERHVVDPGPAGVLAALAIGDQAAIDRPGWELFRITGVAHLMSISGLHVTMFAWLAGAVAAALWRRHRSAPLHLPVPQAARWVGLAAAALYSLACGWGVPAQRTLWMLAVVVVLRGSGRQWPLHGVLLAAGWLVALFDPWALLQAGFWLSFVAVALLVAAEPVRGLDEPANRAAPGAWARRRAAVKSVLEEGLRSQVVATIGLAPLSLLFFQQLSLVGFAANLVAIPIVTLLITPLALVGVLLPPLWQAAAWVVGALNTYLQMLAATPWVVWSAAAAPAWAVAAGLLGGTLAVAPLPWRLRWLALPLMLPLLAPAVGRPAPGEFELMAVDIGQGTAVLLRTRTHTLLYDTGPMYSAESDAGSRVLVPLLRALGQQRLNLVMLSHRDMDHVGGAAAVLAAVPVDAGSSSLAPDNPLRASMPVHRRCEAGQRWHWDGVQFEVLHPVASDYDRPAPPNAMSCVLRVVSASGVSALLTGDIEAAQEAALLARAAAAVPQNPTTPMAPHPLRSDFLLAPHHGSRTSSTAPFLDAVAPRVAVFQAAYRSRYGHPAPDVLARYAERGITIVRSDHCGATIWRSGGEPQCQRDLARRYWHFRAAP